MNVTLLAAIIGVLAGAIGYWFTTFSMQPILRYRNLKHRVFADFIYYKQVINADGLNDDMQKLYRERILANRKSSSELTATIQDIPWWYLKYLKAKGHKPEDAAGHLIGFSNTSDTEKSYKIEALIRRQLGLPPEK